MPRQILCLILIGIAIGCRSAKTVDDDPLEPDVTIREEGNPDDTPRDASIPPRHDAVQLGATVQDDVWFEEVSAKSGVSFSYHDGKESAGYQLIESVGGGVALFDYDRDGDLDLLAAAGGDIANADGNLSLSGRRSHLFRNDGDGRLADVTDEVGLSTVPAFYSHGVTVGDFDADGFEDLVVAGYDGLLVLRNDGGSQFIDATPSAGINQQGWNVSAAFADFDADGLLDLYVLTYATWELDPIHKCINDQRLRDICGPTHYEGSLDRLYRNRGDGTFEDVTEAAGIGPANRGLGVVAADFNGDHRIDFYVANDVQDNQLYLGGEGLPFRSEALLMGVALSADGQRQGSMGVTVADVDRDGAMDLFYTNYATEDNSLMRATANGFVDVTSTFSLTGRSRPWVGFGTVIADFDADGWPDLMITNGHVAYERKDSSYLQPAQLFRNENGKGFEEVVDAAGRYFGVDHSGRGLAVGDINGDGMIDAVISQQTEPIAVLKNALPPRRQLSLRLVGVKTNRDAVGASVRLLEGDTQPAAKRWRIGGGSYLSSSESTMRFALPEESGTATIEVSWPNGDVELFEDLEAGVMHVIREGAGKTDR